ncbi:MAG: ATP-binding protein [Candidatus Aminicenantes bacterium]|nr:ATP-binding protein [Candidatus Aminicenantes bacterium]
MDASLTFLAVLGEIGRARAFLRERAAAFPFSEEDLFRIELAVTEVLINIVRYAYPAAPGDMTLRVWDEAGVLHVECSDRGRPFDPRQFPDPSLENMTSGERKGGLGVYLARRLSDGFDYRREDGRNVVTISKRIPVRGPTDQ